MRTNQEILSLWGDTDKCEDFAPILQELLLERTTLKEKLVSGQAALVVYGRLENWSDRMMRQGRLIYMPKILISEAGPTLAVEALKLIGDLI